MTRHAAISAPHTAPSAALRGVRWFISPDALRLYAPAMLNGHAAQVREAELIIDLTDNSPRALLRLCYGPSDRADHALPIPAAAVAITPDESGTMEHIEIPGVISLTIGRNRGEPKLIYAHSPLLAAIGLPGGVYDVPELLLA